jgi:hypothetical protein
VIGYGRAMIGATDPLKAVPGTIRGDYGVDGGRNLIVSKPGLLSLDDPLPALCQAFWYFIQVWYLALMVYSCFVFFSAAWQ